MSSITFLMRAPARVVQVAAEALNSALHGWRRQACRCRDAAPSWNGRPASAQMMRRTQ
jgi:hypothetical protein